MPSTPSSQSTAPGPGTSAGQGVHAALQALGRELADRLGRVIAGLPEGSAGPQKLAAALGVDKVLASRVLKGIRQRDPLAVVHELPGPDPLRRFLRAARRRGAAAEDVRGAARAVGTFERTIRDEAGDRSSLNAMISAWLPAARDEFELRRKQAAFKALSQLKGAEARVGFSAAWLAPAASGERIDVVWLLGVLGLQRLRPQATVKFATRRIVSGAAPRRPRGLDGAEFEDLEQVRLDAFCSQPPAPLEVYRSGECTHYVLGDTGFGPRSGVDLVFAEVNREEMARWVDPALGRKGYVFADVTIPSRVLSLDVFVHREIYPDSDPELSIYDTAVEGVADVNDRSRDIDRLDVRESIESIGRGLAGARHPDASDYVGILDHVHARMGWDPADFRGWRCRVDYPIYGSQIAVAFDPPPPPARSGPPRG